MVAMANILKASAGHLRPFDIRRDLHDVADLVELCFAETLDRDGQRYVKQMREAAHNNLFIHWASSMGERASLPLTGYVWEESGRLVGNLSLIPFFLRGRRCYLIANVAVHPEFRRQGIARALTTRALEHIHSRQARAAWLHVREENDPALRLYLSLGFQERARRTTWHSLPSRMEPFPTPFLNPTYQVDIQAGGSWHWPEQHDWLMRIYPPEIAWHLPLNMSALSPNLWGAIYRMFSGIQVRHWVARRGQAFLAALVWQNNHAYSDSFWLAAPPEADGPVITLLLHSARQSLSPRRNVSLDFPAGSFVQDIRAAGFQMHHTLIWMELNFHSK